MKILSSKEFSSKLRVSIQSSGKLCFTDETARTLKLSEVKAVKFGQDDEDSSQLYLIIPSTDDPDSFEVKTSGKYYYIPTKSLFDSLGIDYRRDPQQGGVAYDLIRMPGMDDEAGGLTYKMNKR